jgi:GNAT superfamily N-acetyltransferase
MMNPPYSLRLHRAEDMDWVVRREGAFYTSEYGWDDTFEALVAGERVGHVFLTKHSEQPQTARLRLLLVESSARGMGLGHVLVSECIRFARSAGYRRITLWTQSTLTTAHRVYATAGFRLIHARTSSDRPGKWNLATKRGGFGKKTRELTDTIIQEGFLHFNGCSPHQPE